MSFNDSKMANIMYDEKSNRLTIIDFDCCQALDITLSLGSQHYFCSVETQDL